MSNPDGIRVWLLDDDAALVHAGKRLLERLGYIVTAFTRGSDAVEAVRASPNGVAVFITDLNMPELSGIEVVRLLAAIRRDLPIIIVSGAARGEPEAFDLLKPPAWLAKPYSRESLELAVKLAVSGP